MSNSLDDYKLYYEDLERKPVKTAPKTTSKAKSTPKTKTPNKVVVGVKSKFKDVEKFVRGFFNNTKKRFIARRKKAQKLTKIEKKALHEQKVRGIIGIGLLFVVVSITYSTYMTALFVDGPMMVAALAPQVIFAVTTLLIAFYKLYK